MEVNVSFTHPSQLPGERAPNTHWIGGWVVPRTVLYMMTNRKYPGIAPKEN